MPKTMTKEEYKDARKEIGTQSEVANLLGVTRSAIAKREAGDVEISKEAVIALESLKEC